jgi:deazaflavin-dependent oxidoreductase (nitroreductase family)
MSSDVTSPLDIPPAGTRGATLPRLPGPFNRWLTNIMFWLFRQRRFRDFRVLRLTTIGSRTGQARRAVLGYFDDPAHPGARIIVASAAGSARHPGWYFNLAKLPDRVWIEVGSERLHVRPEVLHGAERQAAWERVVAEAPSYASYPAATDREIPLVRLWPA